MRELSLSVILAVLAGCSSKDSSQAKAGHERGPCFENGTCMAGLECRSGLCVGPGNEASVPGAQDTSFSTYEKKSKTTEAREQVKKIYDGARAYWMDPAAAAGQIQANAPQFPSPSVGPTPPLGQCCRDGGKCKPNPDLWSNPTWRALHFSMDDPHYYSYEYKVSVGAPGALDGSHNFTAIAYGDLDCDGEYSEFSMYGEVNEAYADGPSGTAALHRVDDLE